MAPPTSIASHDGPPSLQTVLGDELKTADRAEWLVADVPLARALFSGVPVARLLARTRLGSDEQDLSSTPLGSVPFSRWDALTRALLGRSPATLERTQRQIARQARAASDEGPLSASPGVVALLAYASAASADGDASMAEIFASPGGAGGMLDALVVSAIAEYEPRLLLRLADPRAPLFEACVRLTSRGSAGPWPVERMAHAARQLASSEARLALVQRSDEPLYPRDLEPEVPPADRRMVRIARAELDALVNRDPRELAAIVARTPSDGPRDAHLDSLLADLARLLASPGALLLAAPGLEPAERDTVPGATPRAPSWLPSDWSSGDAGAAMADAFERGTTTQPRMRAAIERGGEAAFDAMGAEMLRVGAHPFASAAIAEILSRSARPRDIVRLITYFAVAPDPTPAARALASCTAPELPAMLTAWLEAMLPHDGAQAPHGADPDTSSGARLLTCIGALAPYPQLYRAVRPLLARVSEAPALR